MHKIQRRISQEKPIKITDIQYHWRFYKPRPTRIPDAELIFDNFPKNVTRNPNITYVDDESDVDIHQNSLHQSTHASDHAVSDHDDDNCESYPQTLDPLLQVRDPSRIKPKGRPAGALNKKRTAREAEFEDSTCREPSRFEYDNVPQELGRGGGRERGRSRGRGGGRGRGRPRGRGGQGRGQELEDREERNNNGVPESMLNVFQV